MTATETMFQSIKHRLPGMTVDDFMSITETGGWKFNPIHHGGSICGAVMHKGNEVHIGIAPSHQGKVWLRKIVRHELAKLLDEHEEVVTYVHSTHSVGHRLALMIGFNRVEMTNRGVKYCCTKVKI